MHINSVSSTNFKGCIPVHAYSFDPKTRKITPIIKNKQIRQCQNIIVSNLNGTKKGETAEDFVDFYKSKDKDYEKFPQVKSFYGKHPQGVYLITGYDAEFANNLAKPLGMAKSESKELYGHTKSAKVAEESVILYKSMAHLVSRDSKRVKAEDGKNLTLNVYFEPKRKKTGEIKGFKYIGANFTDNNGTIIHRTHNSDKYKK